MTEATWRDITAVATKDLAPTRRAVHVGAQPLAAAGITVVLERPSDHHTNATLDRERVALLGRRTPSGHRVVYHLTGFELALEDAGGETIARLNLNGRTLDEAYAWTSGALAGTGHPVPPSGLRRPTYPAPEHPAARAGARLERPEPAALATLGAWLINAHTLLSAVTDRIAEASEVCIWPHGFDIATMITLDPPDTDPGQARSINVGLATGDGAIEQPYFYITPWPFPENAERPELPHGATWHDEGWKGALLLGETLAAADDPQRAATEVVDRAIELGRTIVG